MKRPARAVRRRARDNVRHENAGIWPAAMASKASASRIAVARARRISRGRCVFLRGRATARPSSRAPRVRGKAYREGCAAISRCVVWATSSVRFETGGHTIEERSTVGTPHGTETADRSIIAASKSPWLARRAPALRHRRRWQSGRPVRKGCVKHELALAPGHIVGDQLGAVGIDGNVPRGVCKRACAARRRPRSQPGLACAPRLDMRDQQRHASIQVAVIGSAHASPDSCFPVSRSRNRSGRSTRAIASCPPPLLHPAPRLEPARQPATMPSTAMGGASSRPAASS